jgi:phosphatidyl-myo-inositol alpha-mannosyltransferase
MTSYYLPSGSKIGVGYQVHAMANGLSARGHDVTVFSGCQACDGADYRTVHLSAPKRMRTFAFARAISRLDLSGFDVLHAHGDDYWLWRRRVPRHVRTMHGSCFEEALRVPGAKEKLRMALLGLGETVASIVADRTVLVSPQTRRWMPWVQRVIPNGVDEVTFSPAPERRDARPTILFVGTYRNRKRGALLMDVYRREVRPAVPDAQLVMVCSDAPTEPGVTVTGRISDEELSDWYRRAWVFCLPSTYEGFGIPYAEALMSGLPVVASPNPGARFVLQDGAAGAIVDDERIGRELIRLLTDERARLAAAQAALRRAEEFRLSAVLDAYESLYTSGST